MKKFKEKLIHWLGGFTEDDILEIFKSVFSCGRDCRQKEILQYADSLFGKSAEEWCEKMYAYLSEKPEDND